MATAQDIIDRAGRLLGVVASGASATAAESADALEALNALLDAWRNDKLMAYSLTEVSKAMTVGDASYTFVASGDFNGPRPTKIESAYMTINGVNYPVRILTKDEWYAIEDKTVTGAQVEKLWYNPTMSSGTVNVWPVPAATNTLTLVVQTPITALATVGTTVAFPPGWERALAYNLALEIAPEFTVEPSANVVRVARTSLTAIKRINSSAILSATELPALLGNAGRSHIEIGQ
jgi:hypothetical protein